MLYHEATHCRYAALRAQNTKIQPTELFYTGTENNEIPPNRQFYAKYISGACVWM